MTDTRIIKQQLDIKAAVLTTAPQKHSAEKIMKDNTIRIRRPASVNVFRKLSSNPEEAEEQIITFENQILEFSRIADYINTEPEEFSRDRVVKISVFEKGGGSPIFQTNNFFVQSISFQNVEDFSLIRGSEGFSLYPFGERPVVLGISGLLIDETPLGQFFNFVLLYQDKLKLSKALFKYDIVLDQFDKFRLTGYFLNANYNKAAQIDNVITLTTSFLVKEILLFHRVISEASKAEVYGMYISQGRIREYAHAVAEISQEIANKGGTVVVKSE